MAIIKTGPLAEAISGTIGGTTFAAGTKSSPTVRNRLRRSKNLSPQAAAQRTFWAAARSDWRSLTPDEQQAWKTAALTYPNTNRLGVKTLLSGYTLFLKLNTDGGRLFRGLIERQPFFAPPIMTMPQPLPVFDVSFSLADGYFFSFVDRPTTPLDLVVLYGFRSFRNTPTAAPGYLRTFATFTTFTVPPIDFQGFWDFRIGTPVVGESVWLGLRWAVIRGPLEEMQLIQSTVTA